MFVETGILGGDGGLNQIGRQFVVGRKETVLIVDGRQNFTVGRYDLRGELAVRILKLTE